MTGYFDFVVSSNELMNYVVAHLFLSVFLFLIALFVLTRNFRKPLNQIFAFYSFAIAWWSLFTAPMITARNPVAGYFWDQMCLTGTVFIPTAFFNFVLVFLGRAKKYALCILGCYAVSLMFLYLNWDHAFVREVKPTAIFNFYTVPSIAYTVFVSYFSILSTLSVYLLYRSMGHDFASLKVAKQTRWLFFASCFGYVGGGTNFLLVYGINIPYFTPVANYAILAYGFSVAYIILKHKFLDIEVIIKKTIVFAGLFTVCMVVVGGVTAVSQGLLGQYVRMGLMANGLISALIAVALYDPTRSLLIGLTDTYLFQKKIDYQNLLRKASQGISRIRSLDQLSRLIVTFLTLRMRIENAAVVTKDVDRSVFFLKTCRGYGKQKPKMKLLVTSGLVSMLEHEKRPIRFEDVLERHQGRQNSAGIDYVLVKNEMSEMKASLVVPCFRGSVEEVSNGTSSFKKSVELVHLLILGKKKSDEAYTEEDVDIFFTLAQESAVAIENARLYDEVIESREEALQAKRKTEEMELELIRREKFVFVEKLVKGIAHEINNPIGAAQMEIERLESVLDQLRILREKVAAHLSEEDKELWDTQLGSQGYSIRLLMRTTAHITQVVDTLNQMQKADDGSIHNIDFKSYWATAVPLIEAQSHGDVFEQVPISAEIQRGLPLIKANAAQLTQIFLNLYRNALYALKDQNNKKITLRAVPDPDDGRFLRIVLQDNGCGIPEDILPKIFDYMYTTKGAAGNGIGLNVCRTMVENFGGSITCESEKGKGAAFIIRLKCSTKESQ